MASKTAIANLALSRLGSTVQLANLDTDNSAAARTMRTFYQPEFDFILRDFSWPFATAYVQLGLVTGTPAVAANYDWQYAYRYPADCVYARRIVTENIGRKDPNPPPFKLGRDSQGRLIFCDEDSAMLMYTINITDAEELDPMAVSMLAWRLVVDAAPSLSRIPQIVGTANEQYEIDKSKAQRAALNEQQKDKDLASELERSRV